MAAVGPSPSPAGRPLRAPAGISEVSRFSCMKFLEACLGLRLRRTGPRTRASAPSLRRLPLKYSERQRPDCKFSECLIPSPPIPLFTLPLCTSRCPTQNSGPKSGCQPLLVRLFDPSTSCRFIPAHITGQCTHYQRTPRIIRGRPALSEDAPHSERRGLQCGGFAPAPPGFIALSLSPY